MSRTYSTDQPEKELATWFKEIRKNDLKLTQRELAERTNIPLGTLRYFEQTGKTSLENFLRIASELHALELFTALARGEEPRTFHKVQKEKTISRLRDELAMHRAEVSPKEMRKRNSKISKPALKWRVSGRKSWQNAEAHTR